MSSTIATDCNLVAVEIPQQILAELKWLAEYMDVPPTQALRAAIATQTYLSKVIREERGEIIIQRDNQSSQFMLDKVLPDKV